MGLRVVRYLSVATFPECLMHLAAVVVSSRIVSIAIHYSSTRVHRLLHLGVVPQSVPVFTGASEGLASILLHELVLVLVDRHVFLVGTIVARLVLTVANN